MKIRTPVILTVISFFFLLPLRWFNILASLGEEVSFAVSDNLFYLILSVVGAVVIFCSLTARGARIRVNTKKSLIMGFIMLLTAALLFYDAIISYMAFSVTKTSVYGLGYSQYSLEMFHSWFLTDFGIDLPKSALITALIFNGKRGLYYAVSCIIGAVGFLLMSYDFFGGKNFFRNKPLLAILPTVWGVVRIVCSYMYYTSIADLSASILDIVFMCSTLIFLFSQARLFADMNAYRSVKIATASGLCSILCCVCSNFIRYALIITERGDLLTDLNNPNMCNSIISVMIAAYIIYIIAPRAQTPANIEQTDSRIPSSYQPISNQPNLFIHSEHPDVTQKEQSSQQSDNVSKAVQDDYYYGDVDSHGRRVVLPVKMNARGTLPQNTYKLRKTSPLSPSVHINTRLR